MAELKGDQKKAFIVPVFNRNTDTMRNGIYENVFPGTTIITDQWKAYFAALRDCHDYEYRHVNHSINFVSPEDNCIYTHKIEGL